MKAPTGQKAKMLAGELYLGSDPQLVAEDLRAQELLFRFNMTRPGTDDERRALLLELFAAFGTGAVLKPSFRCDYGSNISIGEDTFINYDCVFLDCNRSPSAAKCKLRPASRSTPRPIRSTQQPAVRSSSLPFPW
jgi:maltose O-acetyltransferase